MRRWKIGWLSSTLLLPTALFLALTGLVSDLLDLHGFFYHKFAGYVAVGLALIHITAYWPSYVTEWHRVLRRRQPVTPPPRVTPRPPAVRQAHLSRRALLATLGAGAAGFGLAWLLRPRLAVQPYDGDLGLAYHQWSTPGRGLPRGALADWGKRPPRYKTYPAAERFALPPVTATPTSTLAEVIAQRRSRRAYAPHGLTPHQLSWLLYCADGLTAPAAGLRSAPSAGAQYPIELYVVVNRVAGLSSGLYHYAVASHTLERLDQAELAQEIMRAGLWQSFLAEASVVFVLTAIFQRLRWRYRERAYRYALLEAGHIAQNIYLAAEAAGLGACAVGAFFDSLVNQLLGVDGTEEAALYLLAVGPRQEEQVGDS